VALVKTVVSETRIASIIRVERINELGTGLAITSKLVVRFVYIIRAERISELGSPLAVLVIVTSY
jgi:hypothetical protein